MSWDEIIKGTNGSDTINGGSGDDFLQGRAGGDFLDGGDGNDMLHGDAGDDHLRGGRGDDFIHGGIGTDTAYYSGSVKDYAYNRNGEEFFLNHVGGTMIDGHDRLISVERLVFADAVIDLTQNNAPIAFNDTASTDEDNSVSGNVLSNDFDWEGNSLTATPGVFNGVYGSLTLNANGTYTYTPYASTQSLALGQNVTDSFTYTVSDGSLSDTGTLTVTVAGRNDAPVANPDGASTGENSPVTVNVLANDSDVDNGAVLTVTAASAPAGQGSASVVANQIVFNPGTDFDHLDDGETATVVVSYAISDEHGATSSSTVTITVNGANDAPVANDDSASTSEDSAVAGNVLANDTDVDGEALTVSNPGVYVGAYGILTLNSDGSYSYTPNSAAQGLDDGETGQDVFAYTASDGTASDTATLTVTVNGANDAPVANDDAASTNENNAAGVSGNVLANDTDADGDTLTVAAPGTYVGAYGTLQIAADGSYTYTPGAGAQGLDVGETAQDVFIYTASDGTALDTAELIVTVTGLNDAPVANDDTNVTDENSPVSGNVLSNDTDVDGEPLTVSTPGTYNGFWGTLVLAANGSYTYTPNAAAALLGNGQSVVDVFGYNASDGTASDSAIITITVNGLSGVPNANNDSASTAENSSVSGNVLANDTDAENDPLTVSDPGTYAGTYGELVLNADGSYTYTPYAAADGLAAGESVLDVFSYTATDGGATDSATLTITVNGVNDAPTITGGEFAGSVEELPDNDPNEGTFVHSDSGTIAFDDVDNSDTHGASFAPQGGGYYGTFTLDLDQAGDSVDWNFTVSDSALENLSEDQEVTQVYTITIDDGHGGTVTQDVTITINGTGVGTGPQTVWYIDNSDVDSANLGTSADPFTSIAAFNSAQGTLGGPQVGHTVHLLAGTGTGIYAEADGINLLSGQTLIGDATGPVRPTIEALSGDGINVAQDNTISGVDIGNTSGADIADSGGSVGTLTISDVGTSGTGQIVDIDQGGTLDVTLNAAGSTASGGGAVDLAGVSGTFTVTGATTIVGVHSGGGIDITGSSVTATFSGGGNVATLDTTAVNYAGNTGALNIGGGFDILTTSGAGLNASGGGTVTVTGDGNSIASTTGTALSVVNTGIGAAGLTFESISSTGAVNGIVLNTTGADGGLTVTGDNGNADNASGGTIAASTGAGILLINTRDVSLDQIAVQNGLDDGIRGTNVTNFELTNSSVTNNGNALGEHGAEFVNLLGDGIFTDVAFSNNEASQVSIINNTGTASVVFDGLAASSAGGASAPNGQHGVHFETQGSASADLAVLNSAFDNLFSNSIHAVNQGTGTLEASIANSSFTNIGASAINIAQNSSGTVRFYIHDNPTFLKGTNSGQAATININQAGGTPAGAVLEGAISNNVIGDGSSANSATGFGDGIRVLSVGAGTTTVRIDGNDIQGVGGNGINVQMSGSANPAHNVNATIFDNNVVLTAASSLDAIRIASGANTGNAGILRLDMHDNDASAVNGFDFSVRQRFATTVQLLDYAGGATDIAAVQAHLDGRNNDPMGAGTDWFISTQAPGGGFVGTVSVPDPTLPVPEWMP
ncbi:MAG TPA: Ig-like domain-containing protein [Allosphingosinicella sp.]|jgi:VCBS repeat-containing protein